MTIDQTMAEATRLIDAAWERERADADALMRKLGATSDEIAAMLALRDRQWAQDRERQLQQTRNALESWLRRDGAALQ